MAAPVHRFAAVDCPPRRPRPRPCPRSPPGGRAAPVLVAVERPTIASLAAARSVTPDTLLRTAALGLPQEPLLAPHLKFGILVAFALATMVLAAAKYYFDRQIVRDNSSGSEASIVCAAVACVCGLGCALSLCRAPPPPPAPPERVSSTARRQRSEPSDDMSLTTLLATGSSPEAPPPYKIAVLMPGRASPPPPAYSELS